MGTARTSPLDPFVELDRGRARFSVRTAPPPELPEVERLLAGAAEVDITPPPGMPKAGYSSNAHSGVGFRTRIRARVLHLRSGRSSIAWVQCDLLGGSSVLQHLVAEAIKDDTDVPLAGLVIGATHTHAGPGQFLGTDFYNRFASNHSGFDPAFTQFLVDRIAGAVIEAVASRRPARLAVGSTEVWGLTRNRSLDPHVQNVNVTDRRQDPQRKYVSVNPLLHLVRVDTEADDGTIEPLSATVVFSVHGTGITQHAHEYNADLWAYLVGELKHRVEQAHGRAIVAGAVQGTHADVAPALRPGQGGHLEARRIGRGIGAEAAGLFERLGSELSEDVELGAGLREVQLEQSREIAGVELPKRPAVGAALVAGAHENLTPVIHRIPPFRAGTPKPGGHGPQAEKWVIGTRWLQPVVLPLGSFPRVLPLQVVRIAGSVIIGLPFEITVETGRRVESAALDEVREMGLTRAIVTSVANEYSGYAATAEEYRRQYYEGGHTLYGPKTERFLAAHSARLAGQVARRGVLSDTVPERRWDLKIHRYLPRAGGTAVERVAHGTVRYVDPAGLVDGYWEFGWIDAAPGDLAWHQPMVRIEALDPDGEWVPASSREGFAADDQGWDVDVTHLGPHDGGHLYRSRWYDPSFRADRQHRFVILANGHQPELVSAPFD
jgi:neutral ceramidase